MKPGPELDALVAEKVLGGVYEDSRPGELDPPAGRTQKVCRLPNDELFDSVYGGDWSPSTEIQSAWEVVEKFDDLILETSTTGGWWCTIRSAKSLRCLSAPHAICLAALKAVGVEVE